MRSAYDLITQSRPRAAVGKYHAYFPTETLQDNLRVFRAIVWRDYMRADCLAMIDQIRSGLETSWDAWLVSSAVWRHMRAYPYLAPPSGEELYLDFPGFMSRGGGDCDNKTLVQCCLLLAGGVRCKAVVIELTDASGQGTGDGHMYCECFIPGRGWVAFDASRSHPIPGQRGHVTPGIRRAEVDFSGTRPQEAEIMRALNTAGFIPPTARLMTGLLTGAGDPAICGVKPERSDPLYSSWAACVAEAPDETPGVFDRIGAFFGLGLEARAKRELAALGLAPEPETAGSWIVPVVAAVAGIGAIVWLVNRPRRAA